MSFRNLFIIKTKSESNIDNIYKELNEFMRKYIFGIKFEPENYYDVILNLLGCNKNYFTITNDSNSMECEDVFDSFDAHIYATNFPKRDYRKKQEEFLKNQLSFIDDLIKIIFKYDQVEYIDVYISDQYSCTLEDYSRVIEVNDYRFTDLLIESYNSIKKENFYGLKTRKYIVRR